MEGFAASLYYCALSVRDGRICFFRPHRNFILILLHILQYVRWMHVLAGLLLKSEKSKILA